MGMNLTDVFTKGDGDLGQVGHVFSTEETLYQLGRKPQVVTQGQLCVFIYLWVPQLGILLPFFGEGSPTKIDNREKGTLILSTLPQDLGPKPSNFL